MIHFQNATSMGQLNESSSHTAAVMSIVSESCVGAWPLPDAPCLVSAVANLKAQSLWEDVAAGAGECDGGEFCRIARLLVEAEGHGRAFGKDCSFMTHPRLRDPNAFAIIPVRKLSREFRKQSD